MTVKVQDAGARQLRILTYNVRYFGHRSGGLASQDKTIRNVAAAIAGLPDGLPELICLQEIETQSLRADLARPRRNGQPEDNRTQLVRFLDHFQSELEAAGSTSRYGAYYFPAHVYRFSKRRNLYTTGLATLVRDNLEVLHHNAGTPFDITHRRFPSLARWKQTRVCGHVQVRHPEWGLIDLFNTHLSLPAFFTKDILSYTRQLGTGLNQVHETKRLMQFIDSTRSLGASTLLVGDFNSIPGSPVHRLITRKHRFHDVFERKRTAGETAPDEFVTAGLLGLRLPIDYVFANERFEWLDLEGTHSFGSLEGPFHGLSDHVPLVARFCLAHSDQKGSRFFLPDANAA